MGWETLSSQPPSKRKIMLNVWNIFLNIKILSQISKARNNKFTRNRESNLTISHNYLYDSI